MFGDEILVFGGTNGRKLYNHLLLFDTLSNTWQQLSPKGDIPPPTTSHTAMAYVTEFKQWMVVMGGVCKDSTGGTHPTNNLYILDIGELLVHLTILQHFNI